MKTSKFKNWVHNLWIDNCEERAVHGDEHRLLEREYFSKFKWWLRRQYQYQIKKEKQIEESRQRHSRWG